MPYPKFFVTYTLSNLEAGSNPFGHAFIIMSEQATQASTVQVKHSFGFYGTSPSSTTNPIIKFLKRILGFGIDLQDSHGYLKDEPLRELDGPGLSGISFLVSKEQYDN